MTTTLPEIATVAEVERCLQDGSTTLVSIDIEGEPDNAHEIGMALCSRLVPLDPEFSYASFIRDNDIKCCTIRLRESSRSRQRNGENLRFGKDSKDIDSDPEAIISARLRGLSSRRLVLVLFSGVNEMKWASRKCPRLSQFFSAYVDVQQLAIQASNRTPPSLRKCLTSLGLEEGVSSFRINQVHRAGNDVVYTLAVLAALSSLPLDAPLLVIDPRPRRPKLSYGRPWPAKGYPFTALIRTLDCTPLPSALDSAGKVFNYFSMFNPIAAGTGTTKRNRNNPIAQQLSRSWICFSNVDDLEAFISATNHATVGGGKKVIVENHYFPGITLTKGELIAKQLEDGDRIREERRRRRDTEDETGYV